MSVVHGTVKMVYWANLTKRGALLHECRADLMVSMARQMVHTRKRVPRKIARPHDDISHPAYVYIYIYTYIYLYMYVYMYIYMYIYPTADGNGQISIYIYICVCIYTCTTNYPEVTSLPVQI